MTTLSQFFFVPFRLAHSAGCNIHAWLSQAQTLQNDGENDVSDLMEEHEAKKRKKNKDKDSKSSKKAKNFF